MMRSRVCRSYLDLKTVLETVVGHRVPKVDVAVRIAKACDRAYQAAVDVLGQAVASAVVAAGVT